MAWRRPSRSRPGQERWESIDSGGAAGSWLTGSSGSGMGLEVAAKAWARTGQALPTPAPVPPSRRSVSAVLQGEIGRARPGRFLLCSGTVLARLRRDLTADQGEEGPQSGSVDGGGVELDSGGKHSRCMEAFKALHLAFSALSCAISISVCLVRCSISLVCRSISRTGRQFSIDNNCRHRGKDEKESPLLLEREAAAGDDDVVIGGEQGDQAEEQAADGLEEAEPIEAGPGTLGIHRFWRSRRLLADRILGIGHGLGGCSNGVGANRQTWPTPAPVPPSRRPVSAALRSSRWQRRARAAPSQGT